MPGRAADAQASVTFRHGVASGDPLPDRVVLWTRVTSDRDVPVTWVVARDPQLRDASSAAPPAPPRSATAR